MDLASLNDILYWRRAEILAGYPRSNAIVVENVNAMKAAPDKEGQDSKARQADGYDSPRTYLGLFQVFINGEGEFRSGWRVLIFVGCCLAAVLLVNALLEDILGLLAPHLGHLLYPSPGAESQQRGAWLGLAQDGYGEFVDLVCAVIASTLCVRFLEHRSFSSVGFKLHPGYARDFAIGLAGGALAVSMAVGLEASTRSLSLTVQRHSAAEDLLGFAALFAGFTFAAAFEELFFRGFAFQALVHNIGPGAALAITSVVFGLAHLTNPDANAISTINTVLAGLWLGVAYLKTRSLWFCTGLHLSWNFVMVFLFGLPVSGITDFIQFGIFIGQDKSPAWISGGPYGPEGGVAAALVLALSVLIIWKTSLLRVTKDMQEAIKHGNPEPRYLGLSLN
jgi:membrane protease YdiL (CAAX protease family)